MVTQLYYTYKTLSPTLTGYFLLPAAVALRTAFSQITVQSPIFISEPSESRTEPYIILEFFPIVIFPTRTAVGAINAEGSTSGIKPLCFMIILFHLKVFGVFF